MCQSISYHSIRVVVSIENLENVKQQLQFGLCRAIINGRGLGISSSSYEGDPSGYFHKKLLLFLLFLIIYVFQFLVLTAEEPQSGAVMIKYICALYVGQVNCHTVTQSLNPYRKYLYTLQFNLQTTSSPPFLAWVDFHAHLCFARYTIPEEKWGTTVVYSICLYFAQQRS